MRKPATGGLVYSTDGGRMCPNCRRPLANCACVAGTSGTPVSAGTASAAANVPGHTIVRVNLDTKGRGGKSVTVVRGLPLNPQALAELGKRLRTVCGAGGTVKDGVLELQGDHCERVISVLKEAGWTVKRAGG
jgi:translation initiation factor 1